MTRARWRQAILAIVIAVAMAAPSTAELSPPVPEGAHAAGAFDDGEPRVEARLLVHPDDLGSGHPVRVGVLLDLDPGWHVYGRDPGDTGLPTVLHWQVDGAEVGPTAWPEPSVFAESDGLFTSYGYAGQVLLAAEAVPQRPAEGPRLARVDVELLACDVECIPARFSLSRSLEAGAGGSDSAGAAVRQLFDQYAARVSVEPDAALQAGAGLAAAPGLLHAILLAFLGGLVLNLMPCVLPVLAIKVVAIADLAHQERREVLAHGLAYTLGILLSMSALAGVVVLLRAAGSSVGWGFQFQEPLFVAAISIVLVVFALNLFGVFEIRFQGGGLARIGQGATGARRSFFEGLLAVVLATPCTAPFLGTAVGFAFASSGSGILAIFLAIGVGLAAPFALVSLVPAWARLIPRSGPWMLQVRAGLGFALLASVVWLLWIVGRTLGSDGAVALTGLLLAVAFAAWLYGAAQRGAGRPLRLTAGAALVLLACGGLASMPREPSAAPEGAPDAGSAWRAFEPAAVAQELERGRRVFVYFTADWCLTCKVNEGRVIRNERVRSELERMDVAVFRGDWTRRDEAIRAELARFGRAGVPLYLVYHPSAPASPKLLPELLTAETLLGALESAPAAGAAARVEPGAGPPERVES